MQHRDFVIITKIVSEIDVALDMIKNIPFSEFNQDEVL